MEKEWDCFTLDELEKLLDPKVIDLGLRQWADIHLPEGEECRLSLASLRDAPGDSLQINWPPDGEWLEALERLKAIAEIYLSEKIIPFRKKENNEKK